MASFMDKFLLLLLLPLAILAVPNPLPNKPPPQSLSDYYSNKTCPVLSFINETNYLRDCKNLTLTPITSDYANLSQLLCIGVYEMIWIICHEISKNPDFRISKSLTLLDKDLAIMVDPTMDKFNAITRVCSTVKPFLKILTSQATATKDHVFKLTETLEDRTTCTCSCYNKTKKEIIDLCLMLFWGTTALEYKQQPKIEVLKKVSEPPKPKEVKVENKTMEKNPKVPELKPNIEDSKLLVDNVDDEKSQVSIKKLEGASSQEKSSKVQQIQESSNDQESSLQQEQDEKIENSMPKNELDPSIDTKDGMESFKEEVNKDEENLDSPVGLVPDQRLKHPGYPIEDEDESHMLTYFSILTLFCVILYIGLHNKQKILAIVLEGRRSRRGRNGRRRPSTANYRKLDSNLEEAVTSQCSLNATQVIY